MPATDAQIEANRRNAAKSCGPRTEAGKAASRRNALKHGLTAEVVIPEAEAAEVERKFRVMKAEMRPSTELAEDLIHDIASMAVRMKRCRLQEAAHLTGRVRQAIDEFVAPEGVSEEEAAELRAEAADLALFDPSPEAERARKYEAAARRGFYKAIHEFRQVEAETIAPPAVVETGPPKPGLASFPKIEAPGPVRTPSRDETARQPASTAGKPADSGVSYVPFAVGKPR